MTFASQFQKLVDACFTGLWVESHEPDEVEREIAALSKERGWELVCWDVAQGFYDPMRTDNPTPEAPDPTGIKALRPRASASETHILVLHNYHRFLNNPAVIQELANRIREGKVSRRFAVVLSPVVTIPVELEKLFTVLPYDLPSENALSKIAAELTEQGGTIEEGSIRAASGLTRREAENAFTLSLTSSGKIEPEVVWEQKAQMLKKSGSLSLHRSQDGFDSLGGLSALKMFCKTAIMKGTERNRPKGVMLLGPPGTGKTCFAKALGKETGRPVLVLDVGAMYSKFVGDSEANVRQSLRIADAMSPAILFIDEVEKALSGLGSSGDSGVSSRIFGTILTWLSDHTSDIYVAVTANDAAKLPPEFSRAGRFDGIFFLDLPSDAEKRPIWAMYRQHYEIESDHMTQVDDEGWTGAEIRSCCRLASLLEIPLKEAAQLVIPVSSTAGDRIEALRSWANNRCLDANKHGIYRERAAPPTDTVRRRAFTR